MSLSVEDLRRSPQPDGPCRVAWFAYVAAWDDGRRSDAHAALAELVDQLAVGPSAVAGGFARWVCELLFDRGEWLAGQWGGGTVLRNGGWRRPAGFALTSHLLSTRVVLPYLLTALPESRTPDVRWLYQYALGQMYRLPPAESRRLRSAIEEHCGSADLTGLLRCVPADPVAQRWLRIHEADGSTEADDR